MHITQGRENREEYEGNRRERELKGLGGSVWEEEISGQTILAKGEAHRTHEWAKKELLSGASDREDEGL